RAEEALGRIWISGTLRHADSPHINPAPVLRASFEHFNDPRAIDHYERAAAVTPWTFHNTRAEEALGRIWISGTLRHADSPHINPAPVLRASWRRGERAYLAAADHGNPYAFHELAKAYRQQGDAQQALRWDLRGMIYERYPGSSSRRPDAVAA
ncbi:hypothetical protein C7E12_08960, partial [Stenotrophomonas maltophilia]